MKKALVIPAITGVACALLAGIAVLLRPPATSPVRIEQKPRESARLIPPTSADPMDYLIKEKDPPTQVAPELTKRLINTLSIDNPTDTAAIMLDTEKDATLRNEAANLLRRSSYAGLTDDLIKSLNSPEEGPLWRS